MNTKAVVDVLSERERQINVEGYSLDADDQHRHRELLRASGSYLDHVIGRGWVYERVSQEIYQHEDVPELWPWAEMFWKPKNPRQDLVRAAAMIIAEIERMDRQTAKGNCD